MYKPQDPSVYNKDQIILNSGRLLLNAKEDAIMLYAKEAISLASTDSVHINCDKAPGFIIYAPQIHLGQPPKLAKSPYIYTITSDQLNRDTELAQDPQEYRLVKGEILRRALYVLLDDLKVLCEKIGENSELTFDTEAKNLANEIENIKQEIDNSLSKQNFTV
jgi:hypothetical protein